MANIKKEKDNLLTQLSFLKPVSLNIIFNLTLITFILVINNNLPPEVPLYYGRPAGEEQLASKFALILPPLFTLAVTFINTAIISLLKDNYLISTLIAMTYILTILSAITVLKIISIVAVF